MTVNRGDHLPVKAIVMSINRGIQRIQDVHTPLEILQKRLEKPEFVSKQKKEMADIYIACLRAKHFEYTHEEGEKKTKYKLMGDLLMIFKDDYKICVPPSMVGLLLSHHHLIAHKGLTRMLAELEPYHFKNKYSITKGFVQSCYSCFLSQTGTKRVKLGSYPTPTCAFEEISVDLAENLNTSGGYSHLLIVKCYLTDFFLIFH